VVEKATEPSIEVKIEMFRRMLLIRRFEEVVVEFMDKAEMVGGAHLSLGQEGAIVGACMALRDTDYMVGTHRSHGHPIAKGASLRPLMAELLGRRTGINKGKGGSMHLADFKVGSLGETSIVAAGLPLAVGGALSAKMRKTDQVALAFFGDGAAQEGAFHESVNLAAVWRLPTIFFCENNGYGMTTTIEEASAVPNVADRAAAYGIPGVTVDGQDVLACWRVTLEAATRGRAGEGPTLINAQTLRFTPHSYRVKESRSAAELAQTRLRDPVLLFRSLLLEQRVLTEDAAVAIEADAAADVNAAAAFARDSDMPDPSEAFTDVYSEDLPIAGGDPQW
jgi:pyruvate dehydrogenase E1 component alpha subunit